ncbi:hypothetical protein CCP4SC76_1430001 [Gammaproteobacteria bacterium]
MGAREPRLTQPKSVNYFRALLKDADFNIPSWGKHNGNADRGIIPGGDRVTTDIDHTHTARTFGNADNITRRDV